MDLPLTTAPAPAVMSRAPWLALAQAALATWALTLPAAAETRPGYGGTVTAALLGEPVDLDPARAHSHAEVTLVSLIYDSLYRIEGKDPGGAFRVTPHLAAALPELSESGLEARITIRQGITFHGGAALGPDDVVESLRRFGKSRSGWLLAPVRSIRALGNTVVLELSRPVPDLAVLLAAPATGITPRGKPPNQRRAVGSGPFALKNIDRAGRRVLLDAFPQHFAGRPYVNQLELHWFERGEDEPTGYEAGRSHMSLRGPVAYAGHTPKYRTDEATGPATLLAYVGFGQTAQHKEITGNPGFRQALSLALDRNGFRGVGAGERVVPTIHPVAVAMDGPVTRDSERRARMRPARAALSDAARAAPRLADAVAGRRTSFELELIIDTARPDDREIAEKVVAALFRLGISARITGVPAREFDSRVASGACDLYIGQLAVPVPTPAYALAAAFAAGRDPFAERALATSALDPGRAGKVFAERLPIVPLFHRALRVHHRSDLRGLRFDDTSQLWFADLFFFGKAEQSR
jgi:MarR-like DNA-binding transcriptional regulator SgrR of sgrS sRNA